MSRATVRAASLAGVVVALLMSFRGTALLSLVVVWMLVSAALPRQLGLLTRLLVAIAVLYTTVATAGFAPISIMLSGTAACTLLAAGAAAVIAHSPGGWKPALSLEDAVGVGTGGALLGSLLLPALGRDASGHLGLMWLGYDHGAHMSILNGIVRAGGYLHGDNGAVDSTVLPYLQAYPQALHLNTAFCRLLTGASGPEGAVGAYTLSMLLVYTVMGVSLTAAATRIAVQCRASPLGVIGTAVATTALTAAGSLTLLVLPGFYSQVGGYALLALLLLVCVHSALVERPWLQLGLAGMLVTAVAGTWFFLLPVAAAGVVPLVWTHRRAVRDQPVRAASICALVALASVPHVYISLAGGAGDFINASGGVVPLDRFLVVFLTALALAIPLVVRPAEGWMYRYVGFVVAAAGFTLALRQYQLATLGSTSYYFEKSVYSILVLSIPAVGYPIAAALPYTGPVIRPALASTRFWALLVLVGAVGAVYVDSGARTPGALYSLNAAAADHSPSFQAALDRLDSPAVVLFWDHGTAPDDFWANRLIGGALGQESPLRFDVLVASEHEQVAARLRPLLDSGAPVVLITANPMLGDKLSREGLSAADLARVTVVVVPRPASLCVQRQACGSDSQ